MIDKLPGQTAHQTPMKPLHESCPDWIARLRSGAKLLFLGFMMLSFGILSKESSLSQIAPPVGSIIVLLPDMLVFIGIWMLTAREPGEPNSAFGIRGITRVLSVLVVGCDIMFAGLEFVPDLNAMPMRAVAYIFDAVSLVLVAFHIANLVMRIPQPRLATRWRFVMTGYAIFLFVVREFILYSETYGPFPPMHSMPFWAKILFLLPIFLLFILFMVLAFWTVWIFYKFSKLLDEQAVNTKTTE